MKSLPPRRDVSFILKKSWKKRLPKLGLITGDEDRLKDYYACAHDSEKLLAVYYVFLRKNLLKCQCRQPMQLCLSYSDMNPKRLYFHCQRNRCKVFQWTDEMPTGRNQELWNPNFVDFNDPL